jgi:hypothetical protein
MNIDIKNLDEHSGAIYNFLHKWAFRVERALFEDALEKMRECMRSHNKGEQLRQGWFFKTLLCKMDRYIDWNIAKEMQLDFENRSRLR